MTHDIKLMQTIKIANTTLFLHSSTIVCEKDYVLILGLTITVQCKPKITGKHGMKKNEANIIREILANNFLAPTS